MNDGCGLIEKAFNKELGIKLQLRRKDAGFSQVTLAVEVGVHRNTLMRWEDGEAGVPVWHLMRIAYVLRCNHFEFLPGREFTWGSKNLAASRERDPVGDIQRERDPQIPLEGSC